MQLLLLKYWMDVSEGIVGLGAPASDVPATPFFPGSTKAGCVSGLHLKANLLSGRVVFTSAGAVHVGDSCGRPYFPGEGGGRQRRHHEQGMQMLKGDESGDTGRVWPLQPGARLLHGINIHVNKQVLISTSTLRLF